MNKIKIYDSIKSCASKIGFQTARVSSFLWRILSLSLADDHVIPLQVLSVVLEQGSITVAYASRFLSRIRIRSIRRYFFEEGKYPTPENVASAVTLVINELRVTRVCVVLVIPKAWTIVKTTNFPLSVSDNLSDVISYELDRLTPLRADKAFYDYQIIARDKNRLQIMVAAVNSEVLRPYLELLSEKKIAVGRIAVGSSALGTLSDNAHGGGSCVFVQIFTGGYEGGVIRDHKWFASFAGRLSSENELSSIRIIAEEINSRVELIKPNEENTEVIIDQSLPEKWLFLLRDSIQAPVRFINEIDLKLHFLDKDDLQKVPYMAVGGALEHLCPGVAKINLLDHGRHRIVKTPKVLSIILVGILIALGLFWLGSPLQIEEWKMEAIDREITARKGDIKKVELLQKDLQNVENELTTIRTFKSSRPLVLNLLKEMTRILPKSTWLTRIRIADSIVEIEGYAASATEIVPKLEASEYFQKVEFTSSTLRDPRLNVDRFTVKMEIEGLPGAKVENGKKK